MRIASSKIRNQALKVAARFFLNRRQARWPGLRCNDEALTGTAAAAIPPSTFNFEPSTSESLIFHARIKQSIGKVHCQIQTNEQDRIEQRQTDNHGVIKIQRTVHKKHADAGNLKNVFNHEQTGQKIR